MTKVCTKCGSTKDENEFVFRNRAKNKRVAYCRPCGQAMIRKHYVENKAYYITKARRNDKALVDQLRQLIVSHLATHPCVDCGEKDILVLEFDHVRGKKFLEISRMMQNKQSVESVKTEIAKCDVRCSNCHKRRTARNCRSWRLNFLALVD